MYTSGSTNLLLLVFSPDSASQMYPWALFKPRATMLAMTSAVRETATKRYRLRLTKKDMRVWCLDRISIREVDNTSS